MFDETTDKLIKEVARCEMIFNECDPSTSIIAMLELSAAEERLNLHFREKKEKTNGKI